MAQGNKASPSTAIRYHQHPEKTQLHERLQTDSHVRAVPQGEACQIAEAENGIAERASDMPYLQVSDALVAFAFNTSPLAAILVAGLPGQSISDLSELPIVPPILVVKTEEVLPRIVCALTRPTSPGRHMNTHVSNPFKPDIKYKVPACVVTVVFTAIEMQKYPNTSSP